MSDRVLSLPKADRAMLILVVEDDRLINMMASDDLERSGYEVVSAFSADQAIGILESRDDVRLLFTDIDMPGSMDGLQLMVTVRDRWPAVPIILTSGMHRPGKLPERATFLAKPYRSEHMMQTVAGLI